MSEVIYNQNFLRIAVNLEGISKGKTSREAKMSNTFGPAYCEELDGERIATQMEKIRDYMLHRYPKWLTLWEIEEATGYAQASISAQLRHLRKNRFGGYVVEKQRRNNAWEYRVRKPETKRTLFD